MTLQHAPPQFETVSLRSCNTEFEEGLFRQVRGAEWQRTVLIKSSNDISTQDDDSEIVPEFEYAKESDEEQTI